MSATIRINDRRFDFFNQININLKYNTSASTFSFNAYFDPQNPVHRNIFRPLNYPTVEITSSIGERLITGVVLNHKFARGPEARLASLSGYSITGVTSDCQITAQSYPLHYTNTTFAEMATRVLSFYQIGFRAENDGGVANEVIEEITAENGITAYKFLSEWAAQRNLIFTHDERDNMVLTRPRFDEAPVATFRQGIPVTDISLDVRGQGLHSEITVLKQQDITSDNAAEFTILNPLVNAIRPLVREQNIGNDVTVEDAVRNVRANELKNIRLTISTDRWEWLRNGRLETMRPNNVISVISPDNYIFRPTNFFVESVQLKADSDKKTAILSCILPQAYNNQEPTNIFL